LRRIRSAIWTKLIPDNASFRSRSSSSADHFTKVTSSHSASLEIKRRFVFNVMFKRHAFRVVRVEPNLRRFLSSKYLDEFTV
jgi:hypothetical protein